MTAEDDLALSLRETTADVTGTLPTEADLSESRKRRRAFADNRTRSNHSETSSEYSGSYSGSGYSKTTVGSAGTPVRPPAIQIDPQPATATEILNQAFLTSSARFSVEPSSPYVQSMAELLPEPAYPGGQSFSTMRRCCRF